MTKDKDFKDLVHARAAETGEKYTAARERMLEDGPDQGGPPRIVGLENRYVVSADLDSGHHLPPAEVVRHLSRATPAGARSPNIYLSNGGRLNVPVEGTIEYATPECSSAREALCHVRAGEALLAELARLAGQRLAEEGVKAVFQIAVDRAAAGVSHESYLAPRSFPAQRIHEFLVPFLVTRQVFAGSGGVVDTPDGARFVLSPRAYSASPGDSGRPDRLVDADANPHADPERYRRIHIDAGDVNRSDTTAWLKVAATRLVLRVIEEASDALGEFLTLEDPLVAFRDISLDPTCKATVGLLSGPPLTAVDVQSLVLRAVHRHVAKTSSTNEERRAIEQWQRTLDGLRSEPTTLAGSVEWVERWARLQEAGEGLTAAAKKLDTLVGTDERWSAHRVCSDAEAQTALKTAPTGTRAAFRGRFIEACTRGRRDYTVDWSHLKLNDEANRTLILKEPFATDDPRVARYLDYAEGGT